jgi:hypothetical protein
MIHAVASLDDDKPVLIRYHSTPYNRKGLADCLSGNPMDLPEQEEVTPVNMWKFEQELMTIERGEEDYKQPIQQVKILKVDCPSGVAHAERNRIRRMAKWFYLMPDKPGIKLFRLSSPKRGYDTGHSLHEQVQIMKKYHDEMGHIERYTICIG